MLKLKNQTEEAVWFKGTLQEMAEVQDDMTGSNPYWFTESDLTFMDGDAREYVKQNYFEYNGRYCKYEFVVIEEDIMEQLNGLKFKLDWEFEGVPHTAVFKIGFYEEDKETYCTIDQINGKGTVPVRKCLYNQRWLGFENLVHELHEQGLEDLENYLYDRFGKGLENLKLFVGGFHRNEKLIGEYFKERTRFDDDVDAYTFNQVLRSGFAAKTLKYIKEHHEKYWNEATFEEKAKFLEERMQHKESSRVIYFETEEAAEQYKNRILDEIREIKDNAISIGVKQHYHCDMGDYFWADTWKSVDDIINEIVEELRITFDKETTPLDTDNWVHIILDDFNDKSNKGINSVFNGNVREHIENGYAYHVILEKVNGELATRYIDIQFELIEDDKDVREIVVKVVDVNPI